jgi:hypothetical protein
MAGLMGKGPVQPVTNISPAAREAGEQNIAKGAPGYNTTPMSEDSSTSGFNRSRGSWLGFRAGRKTSKIGNKFNRCVKSVRSTVKARKGSNKESAAIAICTTSVLYPRGRTIKRYRKKRLITQKKFRGGAISSEDMKMLKTSALVSGKTVVSGDSLKPGVCYSMEDGTGLGQMKNRKPLSSNEPKIFFEKAPEGVAYTRDTVFVEVPCETGGRSRKTPRRR